MGGPRDFWRTRSRERAANSSTASAYFYLKNEALNGNGFQQNLIGAPRTADKQAQPGFFVGGPVLKNRLFFSSAYEYFRSRSQAVPFTFLLPTPNLLNFTAPNPAARKLLTEFPSPR